MKVLQINVVYGILSTGVTTYQMSEYLTSQGVENHTYYGISKNNHPNATFMNSSINYRVDKFLTRIIGGRRGYFSHFQTFKLLRFIKKYKPDVVHLRVLHENFIHIPMLLKYLAEKKIATVITLHDCFMFTGGCMHPTYANCNKFERKCDNCTISGASKSFQDKYKYLKTNSNLAVVGVSNWITNEGRKAAMFKNARVIKTIYNWIDLNVFKPLNSEEYLKQRAKIAPGYNFITLCVASNWYKAKGLDDVLALADKLKEDECIVLVGRIPDDCILSGNIIHIPATHNLSMLAELYSSADVFFTPSIAETFGKVIAESLACGTPAVVYNKTACPELVEDGCGIVVDNPHDIDSVYDAISNVRKLDKRSFSENCVSKAKRDFNSFHNMAAYLDLYKWLIK